MAASWRHLAERFFGAVTARDLEPVELQELRGLLSTGEFDLFMAQPPMDRRHGFQAARFAADAGAADDVVRAAALHDVAKRHARLGIIGRVLASLLIKSGLPVRGRFRAYRDHGPIGAEELERIGSGVVTIEYARSHHGVPSDAIEPEVWSLLQAADAGSDRPRSVTPHR